MYNLFTILNHAYIPFGKIWLNSMRDKINMNNVNNIFVVDTGLTEEDKTFLNQYDKVDILESDIDIKRTSNSNITNSLWLQHVLRKTVYLHKLIDRLPEENFPIVMIDNDTMFLGDIEEFLDNSYDLQVCLRSYHKEKAAWIASFFVAHNKEKSKKFLEEWIQEIKDTMITRPERKWFESFSLNSLLNRVIGQEKYKIGNLPTNIICCERPESLTENTKMVHFKGDHEKSNIISRLQRFPFDSVLKKIEEYNNE